jgi:hypothetical protein
VRAPPLKRTLMEAYSIDPFRAFGQKYPRSMWPADCGVFGYRPAGWSALTSTGANGLPTRLLPQWPFEPLRRRNGLLTARSDCGSRSHRNVTVLWDRGPVRPNRQRKSTPCCSDSTRRPVLHPAILAQRGRNSGRMSRGEDTANQTHVLAATVRSRRRPSARYRR